MNQDLKVLIGIGVATCIIIGAALFFLGGQIKPSKTTEGKANPEVLIRPESHKSASDSAAAKVTIVEFGDYQCPACGLAHPVLKRVVAENAGKVNLVFRNFPLPMHPNAPIAAEAAEAAAVQGKFWEMHDLLYEKQTEWSELSNALPKLVEYAQSLGLDSKKFEDEVSSNAYGTLINGDKTDGMTLEVSATPTLYINGEKYTGDPSNYDAFNKAVQAKLQ